MTPIVVIPCLNESEVLGATVASLGFGADGGAGEALLVLVDNGSTDGTRSLMEDIVGRSPAGASIRIASEPERGFVPARRAGILAARTFAIEHGMREDEALILQADADTRYAPGYVAAMTAAAISGGPGRLYEGRNSVPPREDDRCPGFQALAGVVDEAFEPYFGDAAHDVIVDDKVAGFMLSDYRRWGGHRREFAATGQEIMAETTRLFIRARLGGGARVVVEGASAVTSQRRTLEEPALAFATAGYPYDRAWCVQWLARYRGARGIGDFVPPPSRAGIAEAVRERRRHLAALFGVLPRAIARMSGQGGNELLSSTWASIEHELKLPNAQTTLARPGLLLERVLGISQLQVDRLLRGDASLPP